MVGTLPMGLIARHSGALAAPLAPTHSTPLLLTGPCQQDGATCCSLPLRSEAGRGDRGVRAPPGLAELGQGLLRVGGLALGLQRLGQAHERPAVAAGVVAALAA